MMTRRIPLIIGFLLALTGCGAAYDEGGGAATPQVEYAANAQGEVGAQVDQDVQIGAEGDVYEDTDPTALSEFHGTLDPYGTWVEDDSYGSVWVPSTTVVGADFAPYVTAGHWSYASDYVWGSDYDWGWAPFHYGRWVWIAGRGWSWIPGRRYAGAWVTWRTGYDGWGYVGWAPLPPTWYWRGGYAYGLGWNVNAPYVFCAHEHLFTPNVGTRIVAGAQVGAIGQHTRPYTPATPGVGVGGRDPAHPTVGGYSNGGPPPGQLGIQSAPVPPNGHPGLMKAQQYATPSSAVAVGARAPALGIGATAMPNNVPGRDHSPSYGPSYGGRTIGSTYVPQPRTYVPGQNAVPNQGVRPTPYSNAQPMPQRLPSPTPQYQPHFSPSPTPQYQPQYQPHVSPTPQYQPQYQPHFSPSPSQQHSFGGGSVSPAPHSFGGGSFGGGGGSVSPAPRSFGGGSVSPSPGGGGFGGHVGGGGGGGGGSRSIGGGRVGGGRR